MKSFFRTTLIIAFIAMFQLPSNAQSVMDPSDPVVTYNSSAPPVEPAWGEIGKWVRTVRLGWNTTDFKCYIYKGLPFRLKFPKTYNPTANDGKRYPMMVFFHGLGEAGPKTDNEYSLYHGGEFFKNSVNAGTYDGYILVMQSTGFWGSGHYDLIKEIIDYMVTNNKLDPFRVTDNGLSAGGQATWEMFLSHPGYIAAALPMSSVAIAYKDPPTTELVKFSPFWNIHGGLDGSPAPSTAFQVNDAMQAVGANYKNLMYPDLGHDTWHRTWTEPDFWPFMLRAYSSNPWPLFGRTEFCPSDPINVTIGVGTGFDGYQWRRNGVLISGATSNTINVTQTGTYDARVLRGTLWSQWSPIPVVIKIKTATVTPAIQVSGLASRVLPGLDGSTSVTLQVPTGYASYDWQRDGNPTTIGTGNTLTVSTAADYKVKVTEQFGCSSSFSNLFTVANANGANKPDPAINLIATTISKTSVRLNWSDNPSPQYNETNFEVYAGTQPGGPYKFIGITPTDIRSFTANGLNPNVYYFFRIRAVNNFGAAAASNEASALTATDTQAPTAPRDVVITGTTRTTITIGWQPSSDDVGVTRYDIYVNGIKSYSTAETSFTLTGLQTGVTYTITLRAKDFAGNLSPMSNQVSGQALRLGLDYKYYVLATTINNLPDFSTMVPTATGTTTNVTLTPRTQDNNIAFLWEGYINIPVTGTYTFNTNSDDGSRMWLGSLNGSGSPYSFSGTPLVNNDGNHGAQTVNSAAITLTKGIYPVAMAFYQGVGGFNMNVNWKTPTTGGNFTAIPDTAFADKPVVTGFPPAKPTNLTATTVSYKQINLAWTRNSTDETAFEIWRSTNPVANFTTVGRAAPGTTTYKDSTLNPNTKYYYRIRAINDFGESDFDKVGQGVDYSYYEVSGLSALPNFGSLTPVKTGHVNNFGLGMQNRADNFALKFSGTINIPTSGIYSFFTSSDDGSKLYIDGFDAAHQVVNNDGGHAVQERSGSKNLTSGPHSIFVTFFEGGGGEALTVKMSGIGLPKQTIPDSWLGDGYTNAITAAPPALPTAPGNLVATPVSKAAISITWNDNSTTEKRFELFRSTGNNTNYVLFASLPANTTSFTDDGLFPNSVYYYRVRAVGDLANTAYSPEDSAKTWNAAPVIVQLPALRSAHYDLTTVMDISANDSDGDQLSFSAQNLPAFASLHDNGNRTATLTLNPTSAQQGVYPNVQVTVSDPNGGTDVSVFTINVNGNLDPVISSISNYTIDESSSISIPLTASDGNGDNLTWSVSNLPNAFSISSPGNGSTATLLLQPNYNAAGNYVVKLTAADGAGGYGTRTFNLTVKDKNPNVKVYVRIRHDATNNIGTPWNTVTSATSTNFLDDDNVATTIGLQFPNGYNTGNSGRTTGNNSGIYPDAVLRDYYVFGASWMPQTANAVLTGLDPARKYTLTLLGNSNWDIAVDNGNTNYTINGVTQSLYVQNNTQNTVTFSNITPAANGTITISLAKGTGAAAGYLNSIVISSLYDDGTAPVAPGGLVAQYLFGQGVQLNWQDLSYNETGFEIWRSGTAAGPFTLIGTVNQMNATSYLDGSALGRTQYFYKVRAKNTYGNSDYSNVFNINTPNRIPTINPINNVVLKNNQSQIVNISATDDAADHITLSASNLPPFVSLTDNGNGTGTLSINPTLGSVGTYPGVTITAKDMIDSSRSTSFTISVIDKDVSSVYLNFTDAANQAAKPWNNLINPQYAGTTYSNLKDDNDVTTSISVNMQDGFEWISASGMRPGNGKEIYPAEVMRTGTIESSTTAKRILVSGLSTSRRYNFVFFNSRDDGRTSATSYTIGSTTVTLQASYNINKTVQINGVAPNASGQVTITVTKLAGNDYGFLNAMVIQSYVVGTPSVLSPTELRAVDATRNTIRLQWQDRSSNETGFDILRASDGGSSYSLVGTVSAGITSFTDQNLSPDNTYFYTVRARNGSTLSNYSNVVRASTYAYSIYVNFNDVSTGAAPWNNTNSRPQQGDKWPMLRDENSFITGIGMENLSTWSGLYGAGMTTGNNSGVYPDNIMLENYGLFAGVQGQIRITGLNMAMKYNFTFFGSSQSPNDVNVLYSVNKRSVLLNTALNTTGTVTLYDIVPDENGEAIITVQAGTLTSEFGLIAALVIQAYDPSVNLTPQPVAVFQPQRVAEVLPEASDPAVKVYPNPFAGAFTVALPTEKGGSVQMILYDLSGRTVYQKRFDNLATGMNYLSVQPPAQLTPGVYLLKIAGEDRKNQQLIKLIRQ